MNKKIGSMEFEEAVNELEKIVATLDEGNLSLKEASNLYMNSFGGLVTQT